MIDAPLSAAVCSKWHEDEFEQCAVSADVTTGWQPVYEQPTYSKRIKDDDRNVIQTPVASLQYLNLGCGEDQIFATLGLSCLNARIVIVHRTSGPVTHCSVGNEFPTQLYVPVHVSLFLQSANWWSSSKSEVWSVPSHRRCWPLSINRTLFCWPQPAVSILQDDWDVRAKDQSRAFWEPTPIGETCECRRYVPSLLTRPGRSMFHVFVAMTRLTAGFSKQASSTLAAVLIKNSMEMPLSRGCCS